MTLRLAAAITTGAWRDDIRPASVWVGDMTDRGYPNAPLELEIYAGDWGILRTEYGWFPVTHFASSSTVSFNLDASHEVKPNVLDQEIVRKAAEILSTEAAWNRAENRKCPANAKTWNIYCALEKATIDVTGGFHHRRPALEVVREIDRAGVDWMTSSWSAGSTRQTSGTRTRDGDTRTRCSVRTL